MSRAGKLKAFVVTVVLAVPMFGQTSTTDRSIAAYQALASRTNAWGDFDKLGAAYLQKGRETSDFTYFDLAEKALTKSIELTSPLDTSAASPLTHLAAVCMGEHRFSDAAEYAERALALGSGDLAPFGLLGDAHADIGDYDQAAQDYDNLLLHLPEHESPRGLVYMHDSRLSFLKFIHGDTSGAIALAEKAVNDAVEMHVPGENLAWNWFQLGEYRFQTGDLTGAEAAYQQSLSALPGYYRGLGALAKVRVAEQRYQDAIALYTNAIDEIPIPEYIAALGDVFTKLGRQDEAQKQYALVEYIGFLTSLNQHTYNRELACFYVDHDVKLPDSLELAQRELEVRRDVYSLDALAWSLYKNRRIKEAENVMTQALRFGTRDALLYFHAGMIRRDMKDADGAMEYLRKALALNPHFHIFYADAARQALQELTTQSSAKTSAKPADLSQ